MAQRKRIGSSDSGIAWYIAARILIGIPFLIISALFITPILFTVSVVYMIFHILMSIVTGKSTRITRTKVGNQIYLLWIWNANNLRWAIVGSSEGFTVFPLN